MLVFWEETFETFWVEVTMSINLGMTERSQIHMIHVQIKLFSFIFYQRSHDKNKKKVCNRNHFKPSFFGNPGGRVTWLCRLLLSCIAHTRLVK